MNREELACHVNRIHYFGIGLILGMCIGAGIFWAVWWLA